MKKFVIGLLISLVAAPVLAEVPVDRVPNVTTLPKVYPSSWLFAHDVNFGSLIAGKVILIDVAADTKEYKGAIDAAQMASFIESRERSELYVAESFYSRGTAGKRTDVVSVYDKSSLLKTAEIILPNSNRAQIVANKFLMRLVDDDRFLLIYNFTPAASASVVDMEKRTVVAEIGLSGCSMIYPTGQRGFSSLCGDGAFFTVQLDEQGKEASRTKGTQFFSVDDDPVFDKPVYLGSTAYFISYKSMVYPVDMSGEVPEVMPSWSLLNASLAAQNWRPSGWEIATSDGRAKIYLIMSENGFNGSHKNGGEEIWVVNVKRQTLAKRIKVKDNAFSIELVPGNKPLLAVTNVNMLLDVYKLNGKLQRTFNLGDAAMPFILHARR